MILLHFFGLGEVLRRFELEQITGLTIMGFRPLSLDELMRWSQNMADQHHWDGEAISHDVMSTWLCLLYTSPSPRDRQKSRMPSSA